MPAVSTTPPLVELLAALDAEAREEARELENLGILPAGFTARFYPRTPAELRESRRLHAAMMLADGPDVFVALARGEAVPRHRLRKEFLDVHERRLRA